MTLVLICLPLLAIELAARPLTVNTHKTTIFERDNELGWRLKPNSQDLMGARQWLSTAEVLSALR